MSSTEIVESCGKKKRTCRRRKALQPACSEGYLNFLEEFKRRNCNMPACELVKRAAQEWRRLTRKQKAKYRPRPNMRPRKKGCRRKKPCPRRRTCKRRKPRCPRRKRRCPRRCPKPRRKCPKRKRKCPKPCRPKKRYACECPGPITNNGFLNFLRQFRKKHCGMSPKQIAIQGGRAWCKLSKCQQQRYKDMRKRAPKKCQRRRRRC